MGVNHADMVRELERSLSALRLEIPSEVADHHERIVRSALAALERERDEWLIPFLSDPVEWHESLPNPYTYQASDFGALVAAVHAYEARALAAEQERDTLRAALERIERNARAWHGNEGLNSGHARALDVIAGWCDEATSSVRDEQAGGGGE